MMLLPSRVSTDYLAYIFFFNCNGRFKQCHSNYSVLCVNIDEYLLSFICRQIGCNKSHIHAHTHTHTHLAVDYLVKFILFSEFYKMVDVILIINHDLTSRIFSPVLLT